jgi:hypothetical protein
LVRPVSPLACAWADQRNVVQMVATTTSAFVQIGVKEWMFAHVKDLCAADQPQHLTCPGNAVYFSASVIWYVPPHKTVFCVCSYSIFRGLIGPKRQFGKGETYHPQLYALIFGALIPIPFWLWQRKFPQSRFKYVNMPVLLTGPTWMPPASGINYSSWFVVGFIFRES